MGDWKHGGNFDWHDEHGEFAARHIKWHLPDGSKKVTWRMYRPGTMRWASPRELLDEGLIEKPLPYQRLLYNLPAMLAAGRRAHVWFVEGEGDVDCLTALGVVAVTHGAAGSVRPEQVEWFRGHRGRITLAMDNDRAGKLDVLDRYDALRGVGVSASQLRIVRGRVRKPKADVRDHLDAGWSLDQFVRLSVPKLRAAVKAEVPTKADRARVLAEDGYGINPITGYVYEPTTAEQVAELQQWAPRSAS